MLAVGEQGTPVRFIADLLVASVVMLVCSVTIVLAITVTLGWLGVIR